MRMLLALVLMALAALPVQATTYYFSDCQAGADVGCHPGSEANDGLSADKPKQLVPARSLVDSLVGGDQLLLARNGSWRIETSAFWTGNNKGSAANHIVIADYTPAGYQGSAKPLITVTGLESNCLTITNGGDIPVHKEGFTFKNIKCVGPGAGTNSNGVFTYNDVSDVLIENVDFSEFGIGVYPGTGNAPGAKTSRLTLRNSFIHDNGVQGLFGGGPYLLLEGNRFDNNGFYSNPLLRNHNIYLAAPDFHGAIVRGNTLTRSAVCGPRTNYACGVQDTCQGVSLVVHGTTDDLVIENNLIDETPGAGGGCYGIQIAPGYGEAEGYAGSVVRGNQIVNVGSNAIDIGSCPFCVVEDNVVAWTTKPTVTVQGVVVPSGNSGSGDVADTNVTVRNNSIYLSGNSAYNTGIMVKSVGSGHKVVNNLVYFAPDTSAQARCFDTTGLTRSSYKAFDHNICYSDRADHAVAYSPAYATLAAAQAAQFDVHGKNADPSVSIPTVDNGYAMKPSSRNSLATGGGHPRWSKRLGFQGKMNPEFPLFIGAFPYKPTITAPASPQPD